MKITEHFDSDEFACRDGTPYPLDQSDDEDPGMTWRDSRLTPLCMLLEVVRADIGNAPITIDSGYRTIAYDEKLYEAHVGAVGDDGKVAPASRSQHPQGRAADIVSSTMKPADLFALVLHLYADGKIPQLGGVGKYENFVHVDVRPKSAENHLAIWGGSRPSNIA